MRDGTVRRAVKAAFRWHWELNQAAWRLWRRARGERAYLLGGTCGCCARCCEEPAMSVGPLTWYVPGVRRLFLAWQRHVNGFDLLRRERPGRVLVFRCTHFDPLTRRCDSYDSRPGICRDYPRNLMWQPAPEMLPGCGYVPVAWNAAALRRALDAQPLTEEQRSRLEAGLRLRDRIR